MTIPAGRIFFLAAMLLAASAGALELNGFDLSNAQIPAAAIERGGPPRDGIPALDAPRFESVRQARWLGPEDRVLGIQRNGVARAYPVAILNWHEIVNDVIGGEPVAITYCPLCGTGVAFAARLNGRDLHFGVSGLLYNSDVLLYDRESESLWSQIPGKAVSGKMAGAKLARIPLLHTTWQDWRNRYPHSEVLSRTTGYHRDYTRNPYQHYEGSKRTSDTLPTKSADCGRRCDAPAPAPEGSAPPRRGRTSDTLPTKSADCGRRCDAPAPAPEGSAPPRRGRIWFSVAQQDERLPPKAWVVGVELNGAARAYPFDELARTDGVVSDTLGGVTITVHYDAAHRSAWVEDARGEIMATISAYWYAWQAFHPGTEIFDETLRARFNETR